VRSLWVAMTLLDDPARGKRGGLSRRPHRFRNGSRILATADRGPSPSNGYRTHLERRIDDSAPQAKTGACFARSSAPLWGAQALRGCAITVA
jgi:hypothetical protein